MGFLDSLSEIGGEKLGEGRVVVGVDSGPLKRGLGDIGHEVEGAATNWGAAFKVAKIGLAGLATAFIGFAIEGTKKADELDAAVGRIAAQVGLTTGETAKLRVGLLDMSTRTKQGVDELAKSIESVAKAGYNVDDSLRIQEASARAATVTNADLGAVTNTVVTAMKAWGVEGKNVGGVVDTLITTVGRSRIDWDALSRILATAAPIAKDAGVSFGDLNAAIIAVGRSGLPARRAAAGVIALIRSMSSPTAQKEMKLLGITVNATTIAHDGLLATLEKIEKVSGKNVSVLVKNKKGQIDYQKSVDATTKANKGQLQALQAMFGGAAGLVTADILLANGAKDYTEAQTALNHSLGATNAEFDKVKEADLSVQLALIRNEITKFAIELGTQLLPYAAKFLQWAAVAIPAALKGIGDLWTNTLAGPIGAMVKSFVGFADALFSALFNWNTGSAQNARGGMTSFFGGLSSIVVSLAQDLGGVFDALKFILNLPFAGVAVKALAFVAVLRGAVSLSKALGGALTSKFLGGLNFLTGGVFKLTGSATAANAGPLGEAARATTEAATKTGEAATKTGDAAAKTSEAAAKTGEAATEAATKLSEAAIRLTEAGTVIAEKSTLGGTAEALGGAEGFNAAEAIRNNTYVESTIEANKSTIEAAKATKAADKSTLAANDSTVETNTQQQVGMQQAKVATAAQTDAAAAMTTAAEGAALATKEGEAARTAAVAEGMAAQVAIFRETAALEAGAGGLRGGSLFAGSAGSGIGAAIGKGAGGLLGGAGKLVGFAVSKAIVPVLIAQLATDIVKAPIAEFISSALHHERVGELMKQDFIGGLVALFQTTFVTNGNDSFVGRPDVTIGNAKFKAIDLAKLGIDNATFDKLDAAEGTIEHAQGVDTTSKALIDRLSAPMGDDILAYYQSITDLLPDAVNQQVDEVLNSPDAYTTGTGQTTLTDATKEKLRAILQGAVVDNLRNLNTATRDEFIAALSTSLVDAGFTPAQIGRLPTDTLRELARLAQQDTAGTLSYVRDFIVEQSIRGATASSSAQSRLTSTDARVAAFKKAFGPNWETVISSVARGTPSGSKEKAAAKKLATILGANWQMIVGDTLTALKENAGPGGIRTPKMPSTFKGQMATLTSERAAAMQAMTDYFTNFPTEAQKGLDLFEQRVGSMNPKIIAELNARFKTTGDDWITALRNGADSITDPGAIAELVRVIGPNWKTYLQKFGLQLFDKEGGDAAAALKNGFAAAMMAQIATLTPKDFVTAGKKPENAKEAAADRKAVAKFLSSQKGLDALAQAAGDDTAKAKTGFKTLGDGLKAAIPDASARERFIGTMVALQKTAATPNIQNVTKALDDVGKDVPNVLDQVTTALYNLGGAAHFFLTHSNSSTDTNHPARKPGQTGRINSAHGGEFSVNSSTDMQFGGVRVTAGEAGSEEVAIVSKPKTVSWAELAGIRSAHVSAPGGMTRGGGDEGGRSQTIYVDHMHVQSKPDERAILETLDFMAPGGIA